jgi:Carboxypeptidase regulatory-like domain/TonB-dependent Receptor Plug Domain
MRRIARLGVLVLACVALGQTAAFAQAIAGVVRDASGGVMPGVTVEAASPALIEKVRTVVTDGDGQYKIINLNPGTYSVTFTLTGFNTVKRDGIELTGDFTAPVNAEMKVGAIEETITVSGASPLIDTQSVTQKKSLTSDMISALPTGRSFQNLSVLVPGVTIALGSQDVGGTGGERYQTLSVHGSRSDQMPLVMNGMPYNNMNNTGGGYNTTLVINTGTVQEMTVTTSGLSSEARSSGVLSNTIPKEGGNTYRGSFLGNFANHSFQSNNLTDDLKARGLTRVNSAKKLWDFNPTVGGPIAKDRIWFYGGFRSSGAQNNVAGMYKNLRPTAAQYCPNPNGCVFGGVAVPYSQDVTQPAVGGDTWTRGETLNLTIQADQKNKFTVFGHFNQRLVDCNVCSATTSPEAGIYFTHRPEYILQSTWTNPVTNKLLLEAGITFYNERWLFAQEPTNINGYGPDAAISKFDNGTGYTYGSAANGNPIAKAGNHQYNMRAALNYVTGSHAFKFGMADMWGTRLYQYDINQAQSWTLTNGVPATITEYARPMTDLEHLKAALGLYAQDRWTINRLTMNLGIRFDYHNAYVPAQDVAAVPFVPTARHYDAIYNVPNWKDLSPRIGATYDLFGDGTTVVRGNYGKYLASESTNMATLNNRINTSVNQGNRSWNDFNKNLKPDCNLQNPGAQDLSASGGDICGALDSNLGSLAIAAAYDPKLTSGFGVRPNDQEIAFGLQRQIVPNVSADFQFTHHWFGNFVASQDTIRVPSAYDPFCVTPASATQNGFSLPNGAAQICGFYNRNPNPAFTPTFLNVTRAKNVGEVSDVYTGYDVNLNARLPRGGTASGGFSLGHEVTDICDVIGKGTVTYAAVSGVLSSSAGTLGSTAAYPSTLYCHVEPPFQPDIKGLVSYPLPWWGIRASATLQNRPGPQILANYSIGAANVATQTTLGRAVTGGSQTVQLIAPGTLYGDRFTQVDLRLGKGFKAGRSRIQGTFDLYNLLNSSAILSQNNTFGTSWRTPTLILQGRLMKLGVQVDF